MTTTTRIPRQAEEFDRALSGTGSVDPSVAALVAVAGALAALPQRPTPAFRDALRTKLMAEAASMAAAPAASVPAASIPAQAAVRTLPKVLAQPAMQVATGGLAAVIAVTGAGIGASRSVPGDSLYGLKRTVEDLQTDLAGGTLGEANALLGHAQTRLDEVRTLLDRAGGSLTGDALRRVEQTLGELDAEIKAAADQLLSQVRSGSRVAYDRLEAVTADLSRQLVALLSQLPAEARAAAATVLATLNVSRARLAMLPKPGDPRPSTPQVTPSEIPTNVVVPPTGSVSPPVTTTEPGVSVTPSIPTETPSVPTITPPTISVPPITVPPVTPPVTLPPLPSLKVTLPPL